MQQAQQWEKQIDVWKKYILTIKSEGRFFVAFFTVNKKGGVYISLDFWKEKQNYYDS